MSATPCIRTNGARNTDYEDFHHRLLCHLMAFCCLVVSLVLVSCGGDAAQTFDHPDEQLEAFQVADGFEVNLFAAEPMLANPIQMTFDPDGRLWVVNAPSFIHVQPGLPNDFISVIEDTDGDGVADRHTVFADGLSMPTGIALGDGGVYVVSQPHLLFLKDTDGDGRADYRRVLLSGFGMEDNHHAISTFRWGPGGHLYFQSGIFLHSQIETPHGVVRLDNGGIFELVPRELKLKTFFTAESGLSNPWGHSFDRWGQNFLNGAAGGGIFYLTPGTPRLLRPPRDPLPRVMAPLTCGSEFISGSHMPGDLHGLMALNDPKMKVVHRYRFSDDGAGYAAEELEPLLTSPETERRDHLQTTSPPFRPVDIKMGPDGALYVLDFYSLIIGHMTYNFRDPNRDKTHGRVWRITARDRPLIDRVRFSELSRNEVLEFLKSPFDFHRDQARRVLYDDPDSEATAQELRSWVQELDSTDPEFEHHLLEALWTFQTIDVIEPDLLRRLLRAEDARVRAAATRVLRYWLDDIEDPVSLLKVQVVDEHPRVRLEAVAALSYIPSLEAAEAAVQVLDFPMDRFLTYALRLTMVAQEENWHPVWEKGQVVFGGKQEHLDFALKAIGPYGDELQSADLGNSSPPSDSTQR